MRGTFRIIGFFLFFLLVFVNLARLINFALDISGLDDSGWYFGVAWNLASKGKYASLTNPAAIEPRFETKESQLAVTPDVFNRTSIIGRDNLDYFPVGVSVGPGMIVPVAMVTRIFKAGYWQFRLFPIITYCFLLGGLLWLVYRQAGISGSTILVVFLNLFPGLTIPLGYEALAEPTGFLYLILGGFFLTLSLRRKKREKFNLITSGIFFSLAGLTKFLYFLNFLPTVGLYLYFIRKNKEKLRRVFLLLLGFSLPIFIFELYRFIFLYMFGGLSIWLANLGMSLLFFVSAGSGLGESQISSGRFQTLSQKMGVLGEIGLNNYLLLTLLLACLVIFIFQRWRKRKDFLYLLLFSFWSINLIWFFLLSATGWARHFWPGLILTIFFLSIILGSLFSHHERKTRNLSLLTGLLVVASLLKTTTPSFIYQINFGKETLISWQKKFMEKKPLGAALPLPIFPLSEQKATVEFIKRHILPEAKIFYVGSLMVGEIAPLVNRVFYSTERLSKTKALSQKAYVIFGPYQVSPNWRLISLEDYTIQVNKFCDKEVFSNAYYKICRL
jgi:hypothetical protein